MVRFADSRSDTRGEQRRLLFLLFLLSFIIRLIHVLSHPALPTVVDAADFDIIAYNLSSGNGYGYGPGDLTSWRAPGYPFFLAGIYKVFGHNYWAARFFEAVLGGLLPVLVFLFGKRAFSFEVGILSAALCVFYPKLVETVNLGLAENLFAVLTAAVMLILVRVIHRPSLLLYFMAGLLMGITTLTKGILLPYFVVLLPLCIYLNKDWRHQLKLYPAALIAIAVVLAPWVARNYYVHGSFVLVNTNGGFTLWYNNNDLSESGYYWGATAKNEKQRRIDKQIQEREALIDSPESLVRVMTPVVSKHYENVFNNVGTPALRKEFEHLSEEEADALFFQKAVHHIKTHKLRFIKKSARSAIKFFHVFDEGARYQWLWAMIFPYAVAGFILTLQNWRSFTPVYCLLLTIWIISTVFESSVRYRIPFEPYFIIFALYAMTWLFKFFPKVLYGSFILLFCLNLPGMMYPEQIRHILRDAVQSFGFDVIPW